MKSRTLLFALALSGLGILPTLGTAQTANPSSTGAFRANPQTHMSEIRALPDSGKVEMAQGRQVPARNLKALAKVIQSGDLKNRQTRAPAQSFSNTQAAPHVTLARGSSLADLHKRADSDVIQLPSGRKLTVGDYKKLSEFSRQTTGQGITERQAVSSSRGSGSPIKITKASDIKALEGNPDSTILENPNGKRITLGELRAYAKSRNKTVGVR